MKRTLLFVVAGLLMGAALHIATVLAVPAFAVNDAWARVTALGPAGAFHVLPPPAPGANSEERDPLMMEAVCRFSLASAPVRITAALPDGFWSVALLDRAGRNVYSLNDSSADRSTLDLAILTPAQDAALRANPPASLQNAIVADLPIEAGIAVLRVFVADAASASSVAAALAAADCHAAL